MTVTRQGPARPVNLLKFGAVRDGPPASTVATSAALNAFGVWARAESAAGRAVEVSAPPGVYHFDQVAAANCFKGIATLVFSAPGAKFLQTSPTGFPWPVGCDTLLYRNSTNPRIAAARKGATRVTAATPSELRQYAPGEMVMIAGQDIQYGGYPPNLYCFDFVRIETIDPVTGVMVFDRPLTHDYLTTFAAYGGKDKWDGSRIFKLDRNGFTWEIDHSFSGFECRHAGQARSNYLLTMGRKVTFRDCDTPGFAESICEEFLAERCVERHHTEPDKLVKKSLRRDGDLRAGFGLQSASVDLAIAENCKIDLVAIGGKRVILRNCDIGRVGFGGNLGFCDEAVFEDCRIAAAPYFYPYMPTGARYNFVDGVNVTYANGVFTVLKNNLAGAANGGGLANWNVLPGQAIAFCRGTPGDMTQNGSHIASDLGTGLVLSVADRPDSIAIATTLKPARVPVWSSGQVFIKRRNPPTLRNCTGAEPVRLASDADRAGKIFGEYFRYLFTAKNIAQGPILPGRTGRLVRLAVNVTKPMTGIAGAKLTLGELAAYTASTMASPRHYQIDIDLTIAGRRDFTTGALRGAVGTDRVLDDGLPRARLPADLWCDNGMPNLFCTGAPFTKNPADAPMFELIFEFDPGLLGRRTAIGQGRR
jgi:hypothetical protein